MKAGSVANDFHLRDLISIRGFEALQVLAGDEVSATIVEFQN